VRGSYTATVNIGITDAAAAGATPRMFFKAVTVVDADDNSACPTCF
jgi:thiamine monophosphate kinase